MKSRLFVFLNVNVDGEDADGLGHDEGEGAEIEGPAVIVLALPVLVFLVAGISCVAGDEDDDADDVAQACVREEESLGTSGHMWDQESHKQ